MGKREENKARAEFEKALEKELRECIKKTGWRKFQSTIFKVESLYFFSSTFFICLDNRINLSLRVKPFEIDNIFWDIMDMEINKNEPLSLRYNGSFICSNIPILEHNLIYSDYSPQTMALKIFEWTLVNMEAFIKKYQNLPFSDIIKNNSAFPSKGSYSEAVVCSLIYEGRNEEAKQLADDILLNKKPKTGDYITKSISFFEHAKIWIEKNA